MPNIKWRVLEKDAYREKVQNIIIRHESDVPRVYLDPVGIPTAGPGKALVVKGMDKNGDIKWVVSEGRPVEGVNMMESVRGGTKLTDEQYRKLQTAADNLNKYGPSTNAYKASAGDFYNNPSDNSQSSRLDPANNKFGVELTPEQQAEFKNKVIDATEADFDRFTTKSRNVPLERSVPLSEERASLISIYHQQPRGIDEGIRKAINNGDRAGVVNAIESSEAADKYSTRRKSEADQFGRPDDPVIIRHESNSQADLDATLKAPVKTLPNEVLPKTPAPVIEEALPERGTDVPLNEEPVAEDASVLDGVGLLKEQRLVADPRHDNLDWFAGLRRQPEAQETDVSLPRIFRERTWADEPEQEVRNPWVIHNIWKR